MDNASTLKLVKNPKFHEYSKHIEVRYHFLHEKVHEMVMNIKHLNSQNQADNNMTKTLPGVHIIKLRLSLGLKTLG